MTQAETHTQITIEHCFTVPNNPEHGFDWHSFGVATTWAKKKAKALGINTDASDWSKLAMNDDGTKVAIIVLEKLSPAEARATQLARETALCESTGDNHG